MPIGQRIIETIYTLKDLFTRRVKTILGGYRDLETASDRAEKKAGIVGTAFLRLGNTITRFVGPIGAAITAFKAVDGFNQFVAGVDRLAKTSAKLGITTEALSQLDFVAGRFGVTTEQLQTGLQRMTRRIAEAAQGSGEAKNALEELGLSAEILNRLAPDQQFKAIADAMRRVASQSDRVRLGFKLFDTEGVQLINTMERGAAGIEELQARADALGKTISEQTARDVEQFNDNLQDLEERVNRLGRALGGPIVRGLNSLFAAFETGRGFRVAEINAEISELQANIAKLDTTESTFFNRGFATRATARERYVARIKVLVNELVELEEEQVKTQSRAVSQRSALDAIAKKDREEAAAASKASIQQETSVLQAELRKQETAYRDHFEKINGLKTEQENLVKEFTDLQKELYSDVEPPEPPDLRDIQALRAEINQQIVDQDFEGAIANARKAAELLRQMKEEGSESNLVLSGTAAIFKRLVEEAEQEKIDAALVDAEKTEAEIEKIKTQLKVLAAEAKQPIEIPLSVDVEKIKAEVTAAINAAQAAVKPIVIKTVIDSSGVPEYSAAPNPIEEIITEAEKRGRPL